MKKNLLAILSLLFLSVLFVGAANAQTDNNSNKDEKKTEKQEKDRPLKIKSKTPPDSSFFSRCLEDQKNSGLYARVRVTFHSSGKITETIIDKPSDCEYFDKETLRIAKKIKFNPEIKNGKPVTVTKLVEYIAFKY